MLIRLLLALFVSWALAGAVVAQQQPASATVEIPANPAPASKEQAAADNGKAIEERLEGQTYATGLKNAPVAYLTFKTPFEQLLLYLTVATLALTLGALVLMGWRTGLTSEFIRAFVVVVIIFAGLFLVAAGYSNEQIAPVYGLLGTIAGYIFGKMDKAEERREDEKNKAPDPPVPDQPPPVVVEEPVA